MDKKKTEVFIAGQEMSEIEKKIAKYEKELEKAEGEKKEIILAELEGLKRFK